MGCYNELAKYYDYLNYDCDYDAWSQYLLDVLSKKGIVSGNGLDMGCGSGKLTELLASKGYSMVGVDRSPEMLSIAQNNKKNFDSVYVLCDMLKINFEKQFDFVNISCDVVNYINPKDEFDILLKNCDKHLKENGILMLDVSSEYKLAHVLSDNVFAEDKPDVTYVWQNYYNKRNKELDFSMILFTREGKSYLKSYEQHKMFVYDISYICDCLQKNGFVDISVYEAFTFSIPKEKSMRIQIVCKKG